MMNNTLYSFCGIQILFIVYCIKYKVYAGDLTKQEVQLNTLIEELYSMYKDAFENEKTYITRRFFTKDGHSHYTLHVQKLKEVDGLKTHNLRIEGRSKREGPFIYINNPVEARMPNPFLSIYQFKNAMIERVEKQKREFDVNRNLLINAKKRFKVFKHLENLHTEIFHVKKYVKQVVDVSNNTELTTKKLTDKLMKTTLHNGSNKVKKGRKQKNHARSTTESTKLSNELIETTLHKVNKKSAHNVHVSRGITSTRIPHIMTTTTLPKAIADDEITTEMTANEKITTESTADEDITTKTTTDQEMTTETSVNEEVTTKTVSDEKNTTQTIDHVITAETTADDGIITKTIADEEVNTETTAAEETVTKIIVNKEIPTEMIAKEELITEPVTTTEPTVRTTRTKQLRPFVFMGDR